VNKDIQNGAAGIAVMRMTEPEAEKFLSLRKSVRVISVTFGDGVVFSGKILERAHISLESDNVAPIARRDVP